MQSREAGPVGVSSFRELRAWQSARGLVKAVYAATNTVPLSRDFALCDQLRRASVSVISNIAEGFSRQRHADFARFLDMSRGSGNEVESLLAVCLDVGHLDQATHDLEVQQCDKVLRMIAGKHQHLRPHRVRESEEPEYTP